MSMHLSDGPTEGLVRIHTERTDWDEPDVRYLQRKPHPATPGLRLTELYRSARSLCSEPM